MRSSVLVIANPAAGRGRAQTALDQIHTSLTNQDAQVRVFTTGAAGDARAFAAGYGGEADVLVSIGGDGTLNEVINGLLDGGWRTPVTIVGMGTENVVARALGYPRDISRLADIALHGNTRFLDLAEADNGRRFVMCAGAGFDAEIVRLLHTARPPSGITHLSYITPFCSAFWKYRFPRMRVIVDGRELMDDATFTLVGNMRQYGGPMVFFPDARPDDGMLDVMCLHGAARWRHLRCLWAATWGGVPNLQYAHYGRGTDIRIECESDVPLQMDGDPAGYAPVAFRALPQAVCFCVPQ